MKSFEVYRNIRRKALIYGLPVGLFSLLMISIIGSLLVAIFSFSLGVIIGILVLNISFYVFLIRINIHPQLLNFRQVFPKMILNKRISGLAYED